MEQVNPAIEVLKAVSVALALGNNVIEIPISFCTPALRSALGLSAHDSQYSGYMGHIKVTTVPNVRMHHNELIAKLYEPVLKDSLIGTVPAPKKKAKK